MKITEKVIVALLLGIFLCDFGILPDVAYSAEPVQDKIREAMIRDSYMEVWGQEPSDAEKQKCLADESWKNVNELIEKHVKDILQAPRSKTASAVVDEQSISVLDAPAVIPTWPQLPDATMSVIPLNGKFYAWWSEYDTYRTYGNSPLLSEQKILSPAGRVTGRDLGSSSPYQNGVWITNVYRSDANPANGLVGFSHIERHRPGVIGGKPATIVEKSMAISISSNNGESFETPAQILSANKLISEKEDIGLGDGCVVKDYAGNRFIAFFSEVISLGVSPMISMAVSNAPDGASGTWYKWHNNSFSEPGLGGKTTPISNLDEVPGAIPSVHFNTHLNKYVMIYQSWSDGLYWSMSDNLIEWSEPKQILSVDKLPSESGRGYIWYPTLIGASSNFAGQKAKLYFAHFPDAPSSFAKRVFYQADINFDGQKVPIPSITGLSAEPAVLPSSGGNSIITVTGIDLNDGIMVTAFEGDQETDISGLTHGWIPTSQSINLVFPGNSSESSRNYTLKASTDGGKSWVIPTVEVLVYGTATTEKNTDGTSGCNTGVGTLAVLVVATFTCFGCILIKMEVKQ